MVKRYRKTGRRSYKKRIIKRRIYKRRTNLRKTIRSTLMQMSESKQNLSVIVKVFNDLSGQQNVLSFTKGYILAYDSTSHIQSWAKVAQGTTRGQRIGNKIYMQHVYYNLTFTCPYDNTNIYNIHTRIMLIQPKVANDNCFTEIDNSLVSSADGWYKQINTDDYWILKEWRFEINNSDTGFNRSIKYLHKLRTKFEYDDASYLGSQKKLPFFVICCNINNTTASAPFPFGINGYINMLYKDI